jgi:transketolase
LTRQKLPVFDRTKFGSAEGVARGAYVLSDPPNGKIAVILMGTGSEVSVIVEAQALLVAEGINARVVSMPSWELFEKQPVEYRESVLPPAIKARLAIEAASPLGWSRYVGDNGEVIALDHFGASAPYQVIMEKFGFTPANVVARVRAMLKA